MELDLTENELTPLFPHGNDVDIMWKQHEYDVYTIKVIISRLISSCNPGKPLFETMWKQHCIQPWKQCCTHPVDMTWKQHGYDESHHARLISSCNSGKPPCKLCGNDIISTPGNNVDTTWKKHCIHPLETISYPPLETTSYPPLETKAYPPLGNDIISTPWKQHHIHSLETMSYPSPGNDVISTPWK